MASIEKLASGATSSILKPLVKLAAPTSSNIQPESMSAEKITGILEDLSSNSKAAISLSSWDYSSLVSIPPEIRLRNLIKSGDVLIPDSHPRGDVFLDLYAQEEQALALYSKGHGICNGVMQRTFDEESKNFNLLLWRNIKALDDLIEQAPPLKEDHIVYRGLISEKPEQTDFVLGLKEGMIIPHQTYMSCATKITPYTKKFLASKEYTLADMRIKLPKGTKGLLVRDAKDEFILPRGAQIKINSIDKKSGIIDAEYILLDGKQTIPDDVLAQLANIPSLEEILKIFDEKTPEDIIKYFRELRQKTGGNTAEGLQYRLDVVFKRFECAILRKCSYEAPSKVAEVEKMLDEISETCFSNKDKVETYKQILNFI